MVKQLKQFHSYLTKFSKKAIWVLAIGAAGTSVGQAQSMLGPNYFGTPMFSYWDQADLAKSGTKGYFGGRLTLPDGADKWPEEFREQLKQYKVSHFASRETIHENEVPEEIKSFPYYELPTLSTESVKIQMKRVARERGITEEELEELVAKHEKRSQWAIFIDPWINIQDLNRDLDRVYPFPPPEPKPVQETKTTSKKRVQAILGKSKKGTSAAKTTKTSTSAKNTKTTKNVSKTSTSAKTAKTSLATSKTATSAKSAKTTSASKTTSKVANTSKTTVKQAPNKTLKTVKG